MTGKEASSLASEFKAELMDSVIPFWEKHSLDKEEGGYFSCLDRDGSVFDTDKFAWMQGRELWCFSKLYNEVEPRPEWLDAARLGAAFLSDYGRAENGDYYFSLDRVGRPLVQPYNIFSDCFCAAGFVEYARAELKAAGGASVRGGEGGQGAELAVGPAIPGAEWARAEATRLFYRIQERKADPKGAWTKQISANRPQRAMAMSMTQLWFAEVFQGILPASELEAMAAESARAVLMVHLDEDKKALFERVMADGSRPQGMDGRLLSPGHALETLFLLLNAVCKLKGYPSWPPAPSRLSAAESLLPEGWDFGRVCEAMIWSAERGWDDKFGGLYYYRDYEGRPLDKLESDMKLWWVHVEAISAFLLAYRLTGDARYEAWFRRIKDWTWARFRDPEYGEWFGYLDRRGEPALSLKGGKWKGMFHLPRALLYWIDICGQLS
ncbi:MAG TPA: AGE family epimerase/isomerase [Rectinemataceae bacterium]